MVKVQVFTGHLLFLSLHLYLTFVEPWLTWYQKGGLQGCHSAATVASLCSCWKGGGCHNWLRIELNCVRDWVWVWGRTGFKLSFWGHVLIRGIAYRILPWNIYRELRCWKRTRTWFNFNLKYKVLDFPSPFSAPTCTSNHTSCHPNLPHVRRRFCPSAVSARTVMASLHPLCPEHSPPPNLADMPHTLRAPNSNSPVSFAAPAGSIFSSLS